MKRLFRSIFTMTNGTNANSKTREAARAEILKMREDVRRAPKSGSAIIQKNQRIANNHLIETRVFCVAEAKRFGEERLHHVRKCCMSDVFFDGFKRGQWPESSPFACWHCAHTFSGPPMGMPVKWDDHSERVLMKGNFCSPSCVYAYSKQRQPNMTYPFSCGALQKLLRKSLGTAYESIQEAPPRECLKLFGGWMDIEEFRNQTFFNVRKLRKDELIWDWIPEEYGVTLWGRLVTVKGVSASDLQGAVEQPKKRVRANESVGLDNFLQVKKTKL